MEIAKGHKGNNIVTVLMRSKNIDLQQASDCVGLHCKILIDRFVTSRAELSSFDPHVEKDIQLYIDALSNWVRGNLE